MNESAILLEAIQTELDDFLNERQAEFASISPELSPIIDYTRDLVRGGKRFRALFCYWSWQGNLSGAALAHQEKSLTAVVKICAALELFHAAALVHDDLIDQSDTRRGKPAMHKRFEQLHSNSGWSGLANRFGAAASILVGDLMLAWSSELFGNALLECDDKNIEAACRDEFGRMRVEVMAGQYLDVLEENAAAGLPITDAVARANRVMLYKTAKYSIEAPLLIGAALAGSSVASRRELSAFAIPLGLAFQLRDDVLGVYGDPSVTGKPAGDDLREGKRTVLVALTRQVLEGKVGEMFDQMLAATDLGPDQISLMQQTIIGTGALKKVEKMIIELGNEALATLEDLQIDSTAKQQLRLLANLVMNRES